MYARVKRNWISSRERERENSIFGKLFLSLSLSISLSFSIANRLIPKRFRIRQEINRKWIFYLYLFCDRHTMSTMWHRNDDTQRLGNFFFFCFCFSFGLWRFLVFHFKVAVITADILDSLALWSQIKRHWPCIVFKFYRIALELCDA